MEDKFVKTPEKPLHCWEDFEDEVSKIFKNHEINRKAAGFEIDDFPPLFRGHRKESWKLKTTLERYSEKDYSITDYYNILLSVEPEVTSYIPKSWNLDPELKIDEKYYGPPTGYDFMIHLRHRGFPSPLLDWSRSPYVAAFFAFNPPPENEDQNEDKNVAIYSYVIDVGGTCVLGPPIVYLGPYVEPHKRHFIQQCQYTICKNYVGNKCIYGNHDEAFESNEAEHDILTKFLIPRSERLKVLRKLNLMTINSHALFGTEESLMETLAYKEIKRKT